MVAVRALGVAAKECGWTQSKFEAGSINELLETLPKSIIDMRRRGEIVILVNGSELESIGKESRLSQDDTVILLPVVHGG